MSNPQVVFLDTGPIVALFNNGEEEIAAKTEELLVKYKFCSRHIVMPSLVELFYRVKKVNRMCVFQATNFKYRKREPAKT